MMMSLPCLSGMRTAAMVRQGTARLPRCEVYCRLVHEALVRPCSLGGLATRRTSEGSVVLPRRTCIRASSTMSPRPKGVCTGRSLSQEEAAP